MPQVTKTVRVRITGKVQGVWFRAWTKENADQLGLRGWVRNCRDGSVEALFSGPENSVDLMLVRCADGPVAAKVRGVASEAYPEPPPGPGFHQAPNR